MVRRSGIWAATVTFVAQALVVQANAPQANAPQAHAPPLLARARQLVVVTTPGWDSTAGTLRRYVRAGPTAAWRPVGSPVPVVVGRAGLAWDQLTGNTEIADGSDAEAPRKREGDGKSPAGVFPLDTAFGFAPRDAVPWMRLPYVALQSGSECVADRASVHYNTVVDRGVVPRVDWGSAERMREVAGYQLGVIVGYNARPVQPGRGSCIFLHVWDGPGSSTAGCTAMDAGALAGVVRWLDPARRPVLVQLTAGAYARVRGRWRLP